MEQRTVALLAALALVGAGCGRAIGPSDEQSPEPPGSDPPWPVCAAQQADARVAASRGVDIILFVDTSSSMKDEARLVKDNLNAFTRYIADQSIDYRVIVVAEKGGTQKAVKLPGDVVTYTRSGICVPPPLAGPNCADGPRFRHVDKKVDGDGMTHLISQYSHYQRFLRAGASVSFVAVTDDDSSKPAAWFDAELRRLAEPGFPDGYTFHSIVGFGADPTKGCASARRAGRVYQQLSRDTGGSVFPVCRTDWRPVFESLAREVVKQAKPPCAYRLPSPPDGKTIQPRQIHVTYRADSAPEPMAMKRVDSASACGDGSSYYTDNNDDPQTVRFCPATCAALGGGTIRVTYGCQTIN